MKVPQIILVLYLVKLASTVGFRYRVDQRTGQKLLWIHVPGSRPNVFTDFEESKIKINMRYCLNSFHVFQNLIKAQ